jgi:hypothetical protein
MGITREFAGFGKYVSKNTCKSWGFALFSLLSQKLENVIKVS